MKNDDNVQKERVSVATSSAEDKKVLAAHRCSPATETTEGVMNDRVDRRRKGRKDASPSLLCTASAFLFKVPSSCVFLLNLLDGPRSSIG